MTTTEAAAALPIAASSTPNNLTQENDMTDHTLIPTTGYNAWFYSYPDDGTVFALPILGLVPHLVSYDEATVSTEFEPCVLNRNGTVEELADLDRMAGYFVGGYLIGVAPSFMNEDDAMRFLSRFVVPVIPGADDEEDNMESPFERARRQARGQYVWPRPYEPMTA